MSRHGDRARRWAEHALLASAVGATVLLGGCSNEPLAPSASTGSAPPAATAPAPGTAAPPAPAPLQGPVTLYGRVLDVVDPATLTVAVQGQAVPDQQVSVTVIGLGPTPACGAADAVAFARRTLLAQQVTLVPDPTLPPSPQLRAYVVLGSQLSYTDAAIGDGRVAADGAALYRPVFDEEQRVAQQQRRGIWGPPCRLSAG